MPHNDTLVGGYLYNLPEPVLQPIILDRSRLSRAGARYLQPGQGLGIQITYYMGFLITVNAAMLGEH